MANNHDDASDDDSDEWGMEELTIPPKKSIDSNNKDNDNDKNDEEEYWAQKATTTAATPSPSPPSKPEIIKKPFSSEPMIIIDMTMYTNEQIHSKFDRNSVNDSEAVSKLRKTIENDYQKYSIDANLLQNGTIIPCSTGVWKEAISKLRDERPGHYFTPIFPPSSK